MYIGPHITTEPARQTSGNFAESGAAPPATAPTVAFSKNPVDSGESVEVTYAGFAPFDIVFFNKADGTRIASDRADASGGGCTEVEIHFPGGRHALKVIDQSGTIVYEPLVVIPAPAPAPKPGVILSKNPVESGERITVTYAGYNPFDIVFFNKSDGSLITTDRADASGAGRKQVDIHLPGGDHVLKVIDQSGTIVLEPMTVIPAPAPAPVPSVTLSKNPVESGASVVANYAGYNPFDIVSFSKADGTRIASDRADASGAGCKQVDIHFPGGEHVMKVIDQSGTVVLEPVTVFPAPHPAPIPSVELSSNSVRSGENVEVKYEGYCPFDVVFFSTVSGTLITTDRADASGAGCVPVKILLPGGDHVLKVIDQNGTVVLEPIAVVDI